MAIRTLGVGVGVEQHAPLHRPVASLTEAWLNLSQNPRK